MSFKAPIVRSNGEHNVVEEEEKLLSAVQSARWIHTTYDGAYAACEGEIRFRCSMSLRSVVGRILP